MSRRPFSPLRLAARRSAPRPLRGAFSLIEMMVSLAVLIVAMAIVSNIFGLTARTASTSVAISQTQSQVRDFMLTLERDLKAIDPAESFLIISGETQAAARDADHLAAGLFYRELIGDPELVPAGFDPRRSPTVDPATDQYSNPRTDIIAFLANQPLPSQAPAVSESLGSDDAARFQRSLQSGGRVAPVLIACGHAALAHAERAGDGWDWPPPGADEHYIFPGDRQELSELPISQWHLGRRALLVRDASNELVEPLTLDMVGPQETVAELAYLKYGRPHPSGQRAGDAIEIPVSRLLREIGAYPTVVPGLPLPLESPYTFDSGQWIPAARSLFWDLLYLNGGARDLNRHVMTVIPEPPIELSANRAVHGLPGCAWFQVEFLMPEDPRNAPEYPLPYARDDMPRWVEVPPGQTFVFLPDSPENRQYLADQVYVNPGGAMGQELGTPLSFPRDRLRHFALVNPAGPNTASNRIIRLWPYAIRITVRAFDPEGRLDYPIVRSLVHRFE